MEPNSEPIGTDQSSGDVSSNNVTGDSGKAFQLLLERQHRDKYPVLMGIINVTPDSFSDGGQFTDASSATQFGLRLVSEGAQILDIGGESTRPGGERVTVDEEQRRVLPVLRALSECGTVLSVDTTKPEVADSALACGAHVINDVTGLRADSAMAPLIADTGAGVIIMHNPSLFGSTEGTIGDPIRACRIFFEDSLALADKAGIRSDRIVLDPGFGFGKTIDQNLELLSRLTEFSDLGVPLLVGTSRKTFIGKLLDRAVDNRITGTLATSAAAMEAGAAILRVHDVGHHRDYLKMISAIHHAQQSPARGND